MPTFLAVLLAACAGFMITRLPLPTWLASLLGLVVWLVVFMVTKRLLHGLRP